MALSAQAVVVTEAAVALVSGMLEFPEGTHMGGGAEKTTLGIGRVLMGANVETGNVV